MFSFFNKTKSAGQKQWTMASCQRMISTNIKSFKLAGAYQNFGKIIKITLADDNPIYTADHVNDNIISENPDSLFIMTSPTTRVSSVHDDIIHPGHNLSFITDTNSKIISCMSKRPGKKIICGSERVPDPRFKTQSTVYVYDPVFTSVEDEIAVWAKRASSVRYYPLYIQIVPLLNNSDIDKDGYIRRVAKIINNAEFYQLHSRVHPLDNFQCIRGSNCNTEMYRSVFDKDNVYVQDMFCQAVAKKIMEYFARDKHAYEQAASELGLTDWIEELNIKEEYYERYSMVV